MCTQLQLGCRAMETMNAALQAVYAISKGIDKVLSAITNFGKKFVWVNNMTATSTLSASQQDVQFTADVMLFGKRRAYKLTIGSSSPQGDISALAAYALADAKQLANTEPAALVPLINATSGVGDATVSDKTITETIRKSVGVFSDAANLLCSVSAVSLSTGLASVAALQYPDADSDGSGVAVEGCDYTASPNSGLDSSKIPPVADFDGITISADRRLVLRFCDTAATADADVRLPSANAQAMLQENLAVLTRLPKSQVSPPFFWGDNGDVNLPRQGRGADRSPKAASQQNQCSGCDFCERLPHGFRRGVQ